MVGPICCCAQAEQVTLLRVAVWLPVQYSFSRNETVAAIKSGKFLNIRGIFSPSATTPTTGWKGWKTAQQAIEDGNETTPSYSLFDMGALCWYFAQELVERGVQTPIGIADTVLHTHAPPCKIRHNMYTVCILQGGVSIHTPRLLAARG
jgi:hypothetical protein